MSAQSPEASRNASRAGAVGIGPGKMPLLLLWFSGCVAIGKIRPLEGGYLRRKVLRDRRPGLPIGNPLPFYPRYGAEAVAKHAAIFRLWWRTSKVRRSVGADPNRRAHRDLALTPVADSDLDTLEMCRRPPGPRPRRRSALTFCEAAIR